jgi:hypothetical protein
MPAHGWVLGSSRTGRWLAVATLLALIGFASAIFPASALQPRAQRSDAEVRIVHGISGVGPVDVYVDGALALIGILNGETSGVLRFPGGEREFAVVATGAPIDAALAAGLINLQEGSGYYAALLGTSESASVGLFTIDERALDPGRARFRIIGGAPDAPPFVPVFTGGDALSEPLGFGDASEYATLEAGTYDLDLIDAETGAPLLALPATAFADGTTTDVIVIGQVADGSLTALIEVVQVEVEVASAVGQLARIVPGTCSDAGEPIADLGLVQPGQGESVGEASGPPVAQGYGLANIAFASLVSAPHAVVVAASEGDAAEFTVCGEIGGQLTDTGALVIALQPAASEAASGIAVLAPGLENPESTGISVFLTGIAGGSSASTPVPANG